MYFNNLTQTIDTIPRYFINNILEVSEHITTEIDKRSIIGKDNKIQTSGKMPANLLKQVSAIGAYIYSQQYPLLKNMVIYETMLCQPPESLVGDISQHSRYLNRIGELFLIPLTGQVKIATNDFNNATSILVPGHIYRINNRIGNRFFSSADFSCAAFTFVDFDLKNYLMPHDLHSPFVRRKDEYADPSLAPDYLNKLPEKNAY
jgi:hypothetical protein